MLYAYVIYILYTAALDLQDKKIMSADQNAYSVYLNNIDDS